MFSAGVGRTGTFIALDFLMQFAEENNIDEEVDIYNLVLNMRHSRPSMVQSEVKPVTSLFTAFFWSLN